MAAVPVRPVRWCVPFVLVPHWNWRGQAMGGFFRHGTEVHCHNGTSPCIDLDYWWRYKSFAFTQSRGDTATSWFGTLLTGKEDGTGTQYRRNRYVDPSTGRFTQEDPIGLAGGLNLYGFAGGDPVTFSDPFGLCPACIAWAVFEIASTAYDIYEAGRTLSDANASLGNKLLAVGAVGLGLGAPGPGSAYIRGGREAIELAGRLGRSGEDAVGIAAGGKRAIPSLTGTAARRIPDGIDWTARTLTEVKNTRALGFTNQIADELVFAKANGLQFTLIVNNGTTLSPALQKLVDLGEITLQRRALRP